MVDNHKKILINLSVSFKENNFSFYAISKTTAHLLKFWTYVNILHHAQ